MEFYSLPVLINDRRELDLELTSRTPGKPRHFVIETSGHGSLNILNIRGDARVRSFVEGFADVQASALEATCSRTEGRLVLELYHRPEVQSADTETLMEEMPTLEELETYTPAKKRQEPEPAVQEARTTHLGALNEFVSADFIDQPAGRYIRGRYTRPLTVDPFENFTTVIDIVLHSNGQRFTNSIVVHLAHPLQFLGIALDFGSESSQMAVKRFALNESLNEKHPATVPLFQNIYSYHKVNNWLDPEEQFDFYQEEKGTHFYKSLFFLKKSLSGDFDIEQKVLSQPEENLKMLVNTNSYKRLTQQERFYQLPNLKILHKHHEILKALNFWVEQGDYSVTLDEIKPSTYNTILKIIIASTLRVEFAKYNRHKRLIRLMLLVPNNYSTAEINNVQSQLNDILSELARTEYPDRLLGWEVLTISESDASFIGYMNKESSPIERNRDYIIVDAGKGTTDFSIIRNGATNIFNLSPIYRNGFTGAGNLITFGLFETVLHFIREQNAHQPEVLAYIRTRILDTLLHDLQRRNDFYNELERLKARFSMDAYQTRREWESVKSGDIGFGQLVENDVPLETVTSLLSRLEHGADLFGYINETTDFICENTLQYLTLIRDNKPDFSCSGVILTGRGFLFQPLANKMKQMLFTELGLAEQDVVLLRGNELKEICIKGVFSKAVSINSEKTGYPIQLIPKKHAVPDPKPQPRKHIFKNLVGMFFNDLNNFEQLDKVLTFEQSIPLQNLDVSRFLIGARTYSILGSELLNVPDNAGYMFDLAFSHYGYFVRRVLHNRVDKIGILQELPIETEKENTLVIPSLLPAYIEESSLTSMTRNDISAPPSKVNPLYF